MNWLKVDIKVPQQAAEAMSDRLLEISPAGIQTEEDPQQSVLTVYIKNTVSIEQIQSAISSYFSDITGHGVDMSGSSTVISVIGDEDWAENYKKFFTTTKIGRLVIKPSWEDYEPQAGEQVIELDPGMAFGTGSHPTTAGCLTLLQQFLQAGQGVIDIGTGSGILAMAAAKLGASKVYAVDNDADAIAIARDNARLNGVESGIEFCTGDFTQCGNQAAEVTIANLTAPLIIQLMPAIVEKMPANAVLILSGITDEQQQAISDALSQHNLGIEKTIAEKGWVSLAARHV